MGPLTRDDRLLIVGVFTLFKVGNVYFNVADLKLPSICLMLLMYSGITYAGLLVGARFAQFVQRKETSHPEGAAEKHETHN